MDAKAVPEQAVDPPGQRGPMPGRQGATRSADFRAVYCLSRGLAAPGAIAILSPCFLLCLFTIMTDTITLGVHGAAGRMGQRVVALAAKDPAFQLKAALEAAGSPHLGKDAGEIAGVGRLGIPITSSLDHRVDVIIDFSVPQAAVGVANLCADRQIPLVMATTGLEGEAREQVLAAAQSTPLLISPSMSLAVNLTMKLVREAARILKNVPDGVDVEIIERHHRYKEDSPSGTALKFGQIISDEMGLTQPMHGRHGQIGARTRNEIGYHAVRTGDNPGEHTIVFGMLGETIELRVAASNRDCYVQGAFAAAKFIQDKKPGLYSMADVLGLG